MSRNYGSIFFSYKEASDYMGDKWDRPYPQGSPRSTRVKRGLDSFGPSKAYEVITIRYQWTDVITYTPDYMILNTAGYMTTTTKKRINDSLIGARVWQEKFVWYITGSNGTFRFHDGMKATYDGMILPAYGVLSRID